MGQIFYATIYDIKNRVCSCLDVDKFHANCYSFSGGIAVAHYLLTKSAMNMMWYGGYSILKDNIEKFTTEEQLLGISVNESLEDIERNNEDYRSKPYADKMKFIVDNHETWKRVNVWNEAIAYYDFKSTQSVRYNGFLVNHTKKEAVDLKDYQKKSMSMTTRGDSFLIDPIPPLTETGGGTEMALFDGCSADTTEHLVGHWCGDSLQIMAQLPEDYRVIDCCFAEIWDRNRYCFETFGLDKENFVLQNDKGERYRVTRYNPFSMKRASISYIQLQKDEKGKFFRVVAAEQD